MEAGGGGGIDLDREAVKYAGTGFGGARAGVYEGRVPVIIEIVVREGFTDVE
jgi:hypothetical protein